MPPGPLGPLAVQENHDAAKIKYVRVVAGMRPTGSAATRQNTGNRGSGQQSQPPRKHRLKPRWLGPGESFVQ